MSTLSNSTSLHVPPSEGIAVRSTDLLDSHIAIGLATPMLVPLRAHLVGGAETLVHLQSFLNRETAGYGSRTCSYSTFENDSRLLRQLLFSDSTARRR